MSDVRDSTEVVPARMLNEFTYCPRLAYLEWVQGEWADNPDTLDSSDRKRLWARLPNDKERELQ